MAVVRGIRRVPARRTPRKREAHRPHERFPRGFARTLARNRQSRTRPVRAHGRRRAAHFARGAHRHRPLVRRRIASRHARRIPRRHLASGNTVHSRFRDSRPLTRSRTRVFGAFRILVGHGRRRVRDRQHGAVHKPVVRPCRRGEGSGSNP